MLPTISYFYWPHQTKLLGRFLIHNVLRAKERRREKKVSWKHSKQNEKQIPGDCWREEEKKSKERSNVKLCRRGGARRRHFKMKININETRLRPVCVLMVIACELNDNYCDKLARIAGSCSNFRLRDWRHRNLMSQDLTDFELYFVSRSHLFLLYDMLRLFID